MIDVKKKENTVFREASDQKILLRSPKTDRKSLDLCPHENNCHVIIRNIPHSPRPPSWQSAPRHEVEGVWRRGNCVKNPKGSEAIVERPSGEPHKMEESLLKLMKRIDP